MWPSLRRQESSPCWAERFGRRLSPADQAVTDHTGRARLYSQYPASPHCGRFVLDRLPRLCYGGVAKEDASSRSFVEEAGKMDGVLSVTVELLTKCRKATTQEKTVNKKTPSGVKSRPVSFFRFKAAVKRRQRSSTAFNPHRKMRIKLCLYF